MKKGLIRHLTAGTAAAAAAALLAVSASADGVSISNSNFETDIWEEGNGWSYTTDWDNGDTTSDLVNYEEKGADIPSSNSSAGINVWRANAGDGVFTQDITVPEGTYTFTLLAMGEGADVKIAVGGTEGGSVTLSGWNSWDKASVVVDGDGSEQTLTITVSMNDGGWAYIDSVSVEEGDVPPADDDSSSADDSSRTDDSSSGSTDDSSKTDDSSAAGGDDSTSPAHQSGTGKNTNNNKIANGDFESTSETELIGWTAEWPDGMQLWFASETDKNARSNKSNNYLNIWNEFACKLSLKQTVHFTPGEYKITFNMDANEDVNTGVKLTVGDLVSYDLPKGIGWDKWAACETSTFKITEEGDYEIAFTGDLAADTWLCLDNVAIVTPDGTSAATTSTTTSTTTTTTAGGTTAATTATTADNTNQNTGSALPDSAAAVMALAAAGAVASKKRKH